VQPAKPTLIPMELCFIESHLCTAAQLLACHGRNEVPAEVTTAILKVRAHTHSYASHVLYSRQRCPATNGFRARKHGQKQQRSRKIRQQRRLA
jgi:hypothetical protein